jgi:hypothetical protein
MGERTVGQPIVPKEHGAWAVLYGAFLGGVGVAGRMTIPAILLLGAVTLLVMANGPLGLILRPAGSRTPPQERRRAAGWLLVYLAGALACVTPLLSFYRMTFLLAFGGAAAGFFVLRVLLVRQGNDRTLLGELIGTAGLALVGPAAHAAAVGDVQSRGAVLWLLLCLFFASGVFYVRMRIRVMLAQRKRAAAASDSARWSCLVYHALLLVLVPALAAGNLIPWTVLLPFAPPLWRAAAGLLRRDAPLNLRRLGWSEVSLTAAFVLLLSVFL